MADVQHEESVSEIKEDLGGEVAFPPARSYTLAFGIGVVFSVGSLVERDFAGREERRSEESERAGDVRLSELIGEKVCEI